MKEFPYQINCDLGEEKNVEADIMPLIQAANIACGAHAGSPKLIAECIQLAKLNDVKIGIHPSYPDRENFGRVVMDIPIQKLLESLKNQIDVFVEIAKKENGVIHHLKFHGALYNKVAKDESLANKIVGFLENYSKDWIVFCPPNSYFESVLKKNGRKIWREAFLDRAYNADGSLTSRKIPGAVLNNKNEVFQQFEYLIKNKTVYSIAGEEVPLNAETFCIHGDHENSLEILNYIKGQFLDGNL